MSRRLRERARRIAYRAAIAPWAALVWLARRILRPRPDRIRVTGRDRVLVVAPHPDDETLGCGGTLALHARGGDSVTVLVVTDGGGSRAGGLRKEEMVRQRRAELEDALWVLDPRIQLVHLAFPEGDWSPGKLSALLLQQIDALKPTLIYAPSCVDYHPEHIRVANSLAGTLGGNPGCHAVRVYEVQVPLTPLLVNRVADITDVALFKRMALYQYRTQARTLGMGVDIVGWPARRDLYLRLLYAPGRQVEVFWELPPDKYAALMRHVPRRNHFRGIHPRPFADGLNWLVGLRERMILGRRTQ